MTQKPLKENLYVYLVDPDEEYEVIVDMRDRRAFERDGWNDLNVKPIHSQNGDGTISVRLPEAIEVMKSKPEEYRTWITWAASKRQGKFSQSIAHFRARCVGIFNVTNDDNIDIAEIDDIANPTLADQLAD